STANGVPAVSVPVAASPSNWNLPVSCTPNTITMPAPSAIARDTTSPTLLRQLPVGPAFFPNPPQFLPELAFLVIRNSFRREAVSRGFFVLHFCKTGAPRVQFSYLS